MTTTPIEIGAQAQAENILADLYVAMPLLTGSLLASADGRALAADLSPERQGAAAAVVASSFALGGKLAELGGSTEVQEMVVRSKTGYVAVYAVGEESALVVLCQPNINLGLLHLKARQAVKLLTPLLADWNRAGL